MRATLRQSYGIHSGALSEFHEVLARILGLVEHQLLTLPIRKERQGDWDITDLISRIRQNVRHTDLLDLHSKSLRAADDLLVIANASGSTEGDGQLQLLSGEQLIEELTGVWLALYFLGTPFVHPWEFVARSSERNGFARGAAVCKATGDVYRAARQARRSGRQMLGRELVLVLDHNPLALPRLIKRAKTEPHFLLAALGACYELFQLRLYIREGGKIEHLVFRSTLEQRLRNAADPGQDIGEMLRLLQVVYGLVSPQRHAGAAASADQRVLVIRQDEAVVSMPACVLGEKVGVFRSRMKQQGRAGALNLGAHGQTLSSAQLEVFRTLLLKHCEHPDFEVTSASYQQFEAYCNSLVAPATPVSGPTHHT